PRPQAGRHPDSLRPDDVATARGALRLLSVHPPRPTAFAEGSRPRDSRRDSPGQQLDDDGANVPRHAARQPRPAIAGKTLLDAGEPRGQPRLLGDQPLQAGAPPLPWLGGCGKKNVRRGGSPSGHQKRCV
ncbi:uncharacterized protein METZ01_LOCUS357488, partial [marine metagenome]